MERGSRRLDRRQKRKLARIQSRIEQQCPPTPTPQQDLNHFIYLETNVQEDGTEGAECELDIYETRHNTRGEAVLLKVDSKSEIQLERDRSRTSGYVLFRNYNAQKVLTATTLEIRSPHMRRYPGVNINDARPITMHGKPMCLFHYREELQAYAKASGDLEIESHVMFGLRYMESSLRRELAAYSVMVERAQDLPSLEHRDLWMVFRPGRILYQKVGGIEGASRILSMQYHGSDSNMPEWRIVVEQIQSNGTDFGHIEHKILVPNYEGSKPFSQMDIIPLRYHLDHENARNRLVSRGKKFMAMLGVRHCLYNGMASFCRVLDSGQCYSAFDNFSVGGPSRRQGGGAQYS